MRNWDGEWLTQDGKKSLLNTRQIQTGLQWYYDMIHKWRTMAPLSLDPAGQLFPNSQLAMLGRTYANYKSSVLIPRNVTFRWNMTIMPTGPTGNRGGMFAGDAQAATRDSKRRDAAYELVKWLCDKETGVQLGLQTRGSTTLGGRPDVYADPRILNHPAFPKEAQEAQLKSVQVMKGHYSVPWNFRAPEIYRVRDPLLNKILAGETQPDSGFLETLHKEVQALLDQPRP
jgi:ABC-type glycerol-3-phosphate transport system substrate-binding protein